MEVVAFDGSQPAGLVGHYVYTVASDVWAWSEGLFAMHGYAPDEVVARTQLMLEHKHPDDRSRALGVLDAAVENGLPFSCYHRIIDRNRRVRSVLSVGHGLKGHDGRVVRLEGYFIDLTQVRREETEAEIQSALARVAEHREAIDEAKGMIMIATGCDGAAAFACLRRYSQVSNTKVHVIANQLVDMASQGRRGSDQVIPSLEHLASSKQEDSQRL